MWEFGIGYGADVFTTLSYYVFGDPFSLISIITPTAYGEIGYDLAILLRFYVSGIAFCSYAHKMDCSRTASLCGAIMYIFSAYSIHAGVRHPYFINPMIFLPLIFLGVEKIFRNESPVFYIISVFTATMSNFYFFYMLVFLTIFYVLVRLTSQKDNHCWKTCLYYLLKFGGFALLGMAMAATLFLPNIMSFLDNARASNYYTFNPFYSQEEYISMLGTLITNDKATDWARIGMAPLVYLGVIAFLIRKTKERWIKYYFTILIFLLTLPLAGYILNGFGYVSNRWVFAWAFFTAFMFTKGYPILLHMKTHEKVVLTIICIAYCILWKNLGTFQTKEWMTNCFILFICLAVLWCFNYMKTISFKKITLSGFFICGIISFTMTTANVLSFAYYKFSPEGGNYIRNFRHKGTAYEKLSGNGMSAWNLAPENDFYRIDHSLNNNQQYNFLLSSKQSTTTTYWSLLNPYLVEFLKDNSAYSITTYQISGLASRSMLLPLASVKYFIANSSEAAQASVPYAFEPLGTNEDFTLYQTDNWLPLGFTYDRIITTEDYDAMTFTQKQQAMLQGAIVTPEAEHIVKSLAECVPEYTEEFLPYHMDCGDNAEFDGSNLTIKEADAAVTLTFEPFEDGELYLQILGLHYQSEYPKKSVQITASCGSASTSAIYYTPQHKYTTGREDYLLNLYCPKEKQNCITLQFSQPGTYSFKELSIIHQPMDKLKSQVLTLKETSLENTKIGTNQIQGTIDVNESRLLCLSIPYSKGWTAYVDGKKTDLLRINVMYCGIMLQEGKHTIELKYCTPYLALGIIISIIGFSGLLAVSHFYHKLNFL